jgi:hypothetical protein
MYISEKPQIIKLLNDGDGFLKHHMTSDQRLVSEALHEERTQGTQSQSGPSERCADRNNLEPQFFGRLPEA